MIQWNYLISKGVFLYFGKPTRAVDRGKIAYLFNSCLFLWAVRLPQRQGSSLVFFSLSSKVSIFTKYHLQCIYLLNCLR